ncbi:unnamed protein product [Parnassius mnemosyne]|uniref:THAP domain-containing protein 9 n=1 Tax=Parnassius mnemosyne TaxID=213953 RepID=A0AAV1M4T6_9NEOP
MVSGPNDFMQHLIEMVIKKKQNQNITQEYDTQLKTFALTLHFYSPRAYNYMRTKFDLCLPHPRTLRGWYQNVGCKPGITMEAIDTIKAMSKEKKDLVIALTFDEMSIREHIEFDGRNHHGYVDVGNVKSIVQYICGYVVKKIANKIKCESCVNVLYGEVKEGSLINMKDVGGLVNPFQDVYEIGVFSERVFRKHVKGKIVNENIFQKIVNECLVSCKHFFNTLDIHMYDSPALSNHKHLIIKLIIETYLVIRLKYEAKLQNTSKESLRHFYNKLVIFGGK